MQAETMFQSVMTKNEIHFMRLISQHICRYHGDVRGGDTQQTESKL